MKGEKLFMNKLFTKIAKIFLGLSMAAGVGVAIASRDKKAPVQSKAATAELAITSAVTSNTTLTDGADNSWSLQCVCSAWTSNSGYIHIGANSKAATSITLTSSAYSSYTLSKIQVWAAAKADTNVTTKISVDGHLLGTSPKLGNTIASGGTEFSVDNIQYKGNIEVVVSRPSSANGAIYFKKLIVTYLTASASIDVPYDFADVEAGSSKSLGAATCSNLVGNSVIWASSDTDVVTVSGSDSLTLTDGKYNGTSTPTITGVANVSAGTTATINAYDGNDTGKTTSLASFTVMIGKYYGYTFTSKVYSANGAQTLAANGYSPTWTLSGGTYFAFTEQGQQLGSNNNPANNATLSTSSFAETIKTVKVNTCGGSSIVGTVSVSVGGVSLGSASLQTTPTTHTFSSNAGATGEIEILWSMTTTKGTFIKSIELIMEQAADVEVESVDLGDDIVLHYGNADVTIYPTFNNGQSIPTNQVVHYTSGNTNVVTVGETTGLVHIVGEGSTTITGTADDDSHSASDTISVTVTAKIPQSLSRSKLLPQFVGDTFNDLAEVSGSKLTVNYSDSTSVILSEYTNVTLYLDTVSNPTSISDLSSQNEIGKDYVFTTSDNDKYLHYVYTEAVSGVNYSVIKTDHFAGSSVIDEKFSFDSFEKSFTNDRDFLLVSDLATNSKIIVSYSQSVHISGTPTATASSSNSSVLTVGTPSVDTSTKKITIELTPVAIGSAEVEVSVTLSGENFVGASGQIGVRTSEPVPAGDDKYVKVTADNEITSDGEYLIVYETGSVAFNGNRSSDVAPYTVEVNFSGDDIIATSDLANATVSIDTTAGTIIMQDGETCIGQSSDANGIKFGDYTHRDISIGNSGEFVAESSSGPFLRYNTSNNYFRYYRSSTYTGQAAVYLYKFVEGSSSEPTAEDLAFEYVQTYLKFDTISSSDKGSGLCVTAGWYTTARSAFLNGNDENFHLTSEARMLVCSASFADAYARLVSWAGNNGEEVVAVYQDQEIVDYTIRSRISQSSMILSTQIHGTNTAAIIVIISMVSVSAIGGYFFLRRRKEQ